MIDVDASAISAEVVEFHSLGDLATRTPVVETMRRNQSPTNPETRVAVLLRNREDMTSGRRIDNDVRIFPVSPLRNFGMVVNAPGILRLRAKLQMIWVAARTVAAKVVKRETLWDRAEALRPVPSVRKPESSATPDAAVATDIRWRQFPTSGFAVDTVLVLPSVPYDELARLPRDVPQTALTGNRRLSATPARAKACRVADPPNLQFIVASAESVVAALHIAVAAIARDRRLRAASTLAKAGRIRAARVVGTEDLTSAARRSAAQSGVVAFQKSWFAGQMRAASTLAKRARIGVGHLISLKDRWSRLAGVHALSQPFQYIVKEVRV
jgi:hypothetical protein